MGVHLNKNAILMLDELMINYHFFHYYQVVKLVEELPHMLQLILAYLFHIFILHNHIGNEPVSLIWFGCKRGEIQQQILHIWLTVNLK